MKTPTPPPSDRWSDYQDRLCLVRHAGFRVMDTKFGEQNTLFAEVLIATPDKGSGEYFNLGDVPVFWKQVANQIEEANREDAGCWIGGKLHQGTDSNEKAYVLLPPSMEDIGVLEAVEKSLDAF